MQSVFFSLLFLLDDIEANPRPSASDFSLAKLQKLPAGQAMVVNEIQVLKSQLRTSAINVLAVS